MAVPTEAELKYSILDEFNGADDLELSAHVDFLWSFFGVQSSDRYALYYYTKLGVVDWLLTRNWRQHDIVSGPIQRKLSQVIDNLLDIKKSLKENIGVMEARASTGLAPAYGQIQTKAPINFENPWIDPNRAELRGLPVLATPEEELDG